MRPDASVSLLAMVMALPHGASSYYVLTDNEVTWAEALSQCQNDGGTLAEIHSASDQTSFMDARSQNDLDDV